MVSLAYCLALHEDMWKIMRSEFSAMKIQAEDFAETLRALPYLNAFIRVRLWEESDLSSIQLVPLLQETLRVHGPASFYSERVVPEGGATLDGYFLPEGTVSRTHCFT